MKWYEIKNKAEKAEIWIYDYIGEDFWTGGGITSKKFQKELSEIKAKQIDLHINSPGGVVFDGITIYNLLKQHPAQITTYIDGLAASIASVIALAGEKVVMAENALYMIHSPTGMAIGPAKTLRETADVLDKIESTLTGTYVSKSGKKEEEIKAMLEAETWMTAAEAKEAGFVDEIAEELDLAACAKFVPVMQKAGFRHIPEDLSSGGKSPPENERDLERVLRDAGYSRKTAQSIVARGFKEVLRDAGPREAPAPAAEALRDAGPARPKKDRVADLLIRAEVAAPSNL